MTFCSSAHHVSSIMLCLQARVTAYVQNTNMRYVPRYIINATIDICKHTAQTDIMPVLAQTISNMAENSNIVHPCPMKVSFYLLSTSFKSIISWECILAGTFIHTKSYLWSSVYSDANTSDVRVFSHYFHHKKRIESWRFPIWDSQLFRDSGSWHRTILTSSSYYFTFPASNRYTTINCGRAP